MAIINSTARMLHAAAVAAGRSGHAGRLGLRAGASPDDPALAAYWANRRRRHKPPVGATMLRLLQAQHGRCPLCRGLLLHADREPQSPREWEHGSRPPAWRPAGRRSSRGGQAHRTNASHSVSCTPTATAALSTAATGRHFCPTANQKGLLEPVAWKTGTAGSEGAPAQQSPGLLSGAVRAPAHVHGGQLRPPQPRRPRPPTTRLPALRNADARDPRILDAQRRERARARSEKGHRWGQPQPRAA